MPCVLRITPHKEFAHEAIDILSCLIGLDHDADSAGTFHLDNLLVIATQLPDPVAATTWSRVKALAAQ